MENERTLSWRVHHVSYSFDERQLTREHHMETTSFSVYISTLHSAIDVLMDGLCRLGAG